MSFQEQNARDQIEERRERKRVAKLLFGVFVPVMLVFDVSCAALVAS